MLLVFASVPAGASPPSANISAPAVTTLGGDGFTTANFAYFNAGPLGTGAIHLDFTFAGATTTGTATLTRPDGSTLSGTETSTVDFSTVPVGVAIQMHLASGTGAFADA